MFRILYPQKPLMISRMLYFNRNIKANKGSENDLYFVFSVQENWG